MCLLMWFVRKKLRKIYFKVSREWYFLKMFLFVLCVLLFLMIFIVNNENPCHLFKYSLLNFSL